MSPSAMDPSAKIAHDSVRPARSSQLLAADEPRIRKRAAAKGTRDPTPSWSGLIGSGGVDASVARENISPRSHLDAEIVVGVEANRTKYR